MTNYTIFNEELWWRASTQLALHIGGANMPFNDAHDFTDSALDAGALSVKLTSILSDKLSSHFVRGGLHPISARIKDTASSLTGDDSVITLYRGEFAQGEVGCDGGWKDPDLGYVRYIIFRDGVVCATSQVPVTDAMMSTYTHHPAARPSKKRASKKRRARDAKAAARK